MSGMSAQNGFYDQATIAQAIAALPHGETVLICFGNEAERRRLRALFRRYAIRLGLVAEIRTQEQFLLVRWTKPQC